MYSRVRASGFSVTVSTSSLSVTLSTDLPSYSDFPEPEMVKFLDKELGGTEEEKMFESYNASIKASIKPGEKYEQLILAAEICHGEVSKIGRSR